MTTTKNSINILNNLRDLLSFHKLPVPFFKFLEIENLLYD